MKDSEAKVDSDTLLEKAAFNEWWSENGAISPQKETHDQYPLRDAVWQYFQRVLHSAGQGEFPRGAAEMVVRQSNSRELGLYIQVNMGNIGRGQECTQARNDDVKITLDALERLWNGESETSDQFDEDQSMSPLNAGEIEALKGRT